MAPRGMAFEYPCSMRTPAVTESIAAHLDPWVAEIREWSGRGPPRIGAVVRVPKELLPSLQALWPAASPKWTWTPTGHVGPDPHGGSLIPEFRLLPEYPEHVDADATRAFLKRFEEAHQGPGAVSYSRASAERYLQSLDAEKLPQRSRREALETELALAEWFFGQQVPFREAKELLSQRIEALRGRAQEESDAFVRAGAGTPTSVVKSPAEQKGAADRGLSLHQLLAGASASTSLIGQTARRLDPEAEEIVRRENGRIDGEVAERLVQWAGRDPAKNDALLRFFEATPNIGFFIVPELDSRTDSRMNDEGALVIERHLAAFGALPVSRILDQISDTVGKQVRAAGADLLLLAARARGEQAELREAIASAERVSVFVDPAALTKSGIDTSSWPIQISLEISDRLLAELDLDLQRAR